jgi:hypothetical protein
MYNEYDVVKAKIDLAENIKKSTEGVILSVYRNGEYYLVEFFDENNDTIGNGMDTVALNDIELVLSWGKS